MKHPQRLCEDCAKTTEENSHGTKFDFCGPPAAPTVMGGFEADDMGMFFKNAVNDLSERSCPFAVDDADMVDSLAAALPEVFRYEVPHVLRAECMKIQHPIDRNLDRIIFHHLPFSPSRL